MEITLVYLGPQPQHLFYTGTLFGIYSCRYLRYLSMGLLHLHNMSAKTRGCFRDVSGVEDNSSLSIFRKCKNLKIYIFFHHQSFHFFFLVIWNIKTCRNHRCRMNITVIYKKNSFFVNLSMICGLFFGLGGEEPVLAITANFSTLK